MDDDLGIEMVKMPRSDVPEGQLRARSRFFKKHIPYYDFLPEPQKNRFKEMYLCASGPSGLDLSEVETVFDMQALVYCILMYQIGGRVDVIPYVACDWSRDLVFSVRYDNHQYPRQSFLGLLSGISDQKSIYFAILLISLLLRTTLANGSNKSVWVLLLHSIFDFRYDEVLRLNKDQLGAVANFLPSSLPEPSEQECSILNNIVGSLFHGSENMHRDAVSIVLR